MRSSRPSTLSRTLALVPPAVALVAQQADADTFLKVNRSTGALVGESNDEKHPQWIEIESFDFKVENTVTFAAGGGMTTGKSKASALTISKRLDRTSPLLFLGCASGIIYPTVNLELARTDSSGTNVTYYKINLSNVVVTSMETSSSDERPTEKVALSYERIVTEYYIQDSKGIISTSPTSTSVWNFATNSAK